MKDATQSNESIADDGPSEDPDALWKPGSETVATEVAGPGIRQGGASTPESSSTQSPWSSGSGAIFAATPAPHFDVAGASDFEEPIHEVKAEPSIAAKRIEMVGEVIAPPRRRSRSVTAAVVLGAVVVVAAFVAQSLLARDLSSQLSEPAATEVGSLSTQDFTDARQTIPPLVTGTFDGADRRRLPEQLDERWRAEVAGVSATGRTKLTVRDDGAVIGVFDDDTVDDGQATSVIVLLDGLDGSEQWRTPFDSQASALEVLGIFGDVIVLERLDTENRAVLGVSGATGEVLWTRGTNDPGVHVALEGTQIVARVTFTANARLTFIDPETGDEVGRVPGRLFATDYRGTWYVRNAAIVSKLDLRNGWNPPTPFETLWVDDDEVATVVGERLVVIDDEGLEVRDAGGEPMGVDISGVGLGGFGSTEAGANFTQLSPMVDDTFVAVRSRSVFGAELDAQGDVDIRWRATGTPIESRPTDRGLALVVATEGGGSQSVIDASTGDEIAVIELVPGSINTLQLVGNGVVVKQSAEVGFERVGLDLDGNRLWALVGEGPLAIGSGVVVTFGPSDAGIAITAYGDAAP